MLETTTYNVKVKLLDRMLGTVPCSESIWTEHIATKQAEKLAKDGFSEEEIKKKLERTIEGVTEIDELQSGKTGFLKDAKGYYVEAYAIKAFYKSAAQIIKEHGNLKQLRSKVVQNLFVGPDRIYVAKPNAVLEVVERPLRAETMQGPRTAIARSYAVPEGTVLEWQLKIVLDHLPKDLLEDLHDFGELQGLGQWRGAGRGRFKVIEFTGGKVSKRAKALAKSS